MGVHFENKSFKISLLAVITLIIIIGIIATLIIKFVANANESEEIAEINETEDYESTSIDIGKSVNEVSEEVDKEENENITENILNETIEESIASSNISNENSLNDDNETESEKTEAEVEESEESVQVIFEAPVSGEIIREFATNSLVYSETLDEWVTHNGVDIKADKTTVVKAAASGTVYSIKSDPRYGLTVIVNHENGYQTVYSNLLTAEYVVEGEEIEIGQTIGTVGNSATFEIADDYHLHFELIKDGEYLDPTQYMDL